MCAKPADIKSKQSTAANGHKNDSQENSFDMSSSSGTNSYESSSDFLGRQPSGGESSSMDQECDEQNDSGQNSEESSEQNEVPNSTAHRPPKTTKDRRRPRKQARPQNRVLRDIRKLQNSTQLLISRLPFQRLVRNILGSFKPDFRVQKLTLECLQEAAEMYLVQLFEDSYMCCLHRQRVTLSEKDIRIAQVIRGPQDPGRVV